eukprot:TRINITY_DN8714_c0_g1_i1.p1 TRINITY_DN8714_c0_g1~~TRINITY_DN8714_c0_g1_i1.p1  ORF type:complete len:948 (+),score=206.85 TRINITY_DN8714_c0_g1_i1:361-2844(+)
MATVRLSQPSEVAFQVTRALLTTLDVLNLPFNASSIFLQQMVLLTRKVIDDSLRTSHGDGSSSDAAPDADKSAFDQAYHLLAQAYYCMSGVKIGGESVVEYKRRDEQHTISLSIDMFKYHCLRAPAEEFDTTLTWLQSQSILPKQHPLWTSIDDILEGLPSNFGTASEATSASNNDAVVDVPQLSRTLAVGLQRDILLVYFRKKSTGIPAEDEFDAFEAFVKAWLCYEPTSSTAWYQLGIVCQRRVITAWAKRSSDHLTAVPALIDKTIRCLHQSKQCEADNHVNNALAYAYFLKAYWAQMQGTGNSSAIDKSIACYQAIAAEDVSWAWSQAFMIGRLYTLKQQFSTAVSYLVEAYEAVVKLPDWKKSDVKTTGKQYVTHLMACEALFNVCFDQATSLSEGARLLKKLGGDDQDMEKDYPSLLQAILGCIHNSLIDQYYGSAGIYTYISLRLRFEKLTLKTLKQQADQDKRPLIDQLLNLVATRFKLRNTKKIWNMYLWWDGQMVCGEIDPPLHYLRTATDLTVAYVHLLDARLAVVKADILESSDDLVALEQAYTIIQRLIDVDAKTAKEHLVDQDPVDLATLLLPSVIAITTSTLERLKLLLASSTTEPKGTALLPFKDLFRSMGLFLKKLPWDIIFAAHKDAVAEIKLRYQPIETACKQAQNFARKQAKAKAEREKEEAAAKRAKLQEESGKATRSSELSKGEGSDGNQHTNDGERSTLDSDDADAVSGKTAMEVHEDVAEPSASAADTGTLGPQAEPTPDEGNVTMTASGQHGDISSQTAVTIESQGHEDSASIQATDQGKAQMSVEDLPSSKRSKPASPELV